MGWLNAGKTKMFKCSWPSSFSIYSDGLRQWTPVISSWINWNASWFHRPRTSHKLQFRQLPNQHGASWAVTSTAQWADCFWECRLDSLLDFRCERDPCSYTGRHLAWCRWMDIIRPGYLFQLQLTHCWPCNYVSSQWSSSWPWNRICKYY